MCVEKERGPGCLTVCRLTCQLNDAEVDLLPLSAQLFRGSNCKAHQTLGDEFLKTADGIRLAGSCLAVGEQGSNTSAPRPGHKGLHQLFVDLLRGGLGTKHLVH